MWAKLVKFFADSETIVWARIQAFIGAVWFVTNQIDLMPVFDLIGIGRYFPLWLLLSGALTEYLRRRRATDL